MLDHRGLRARASGLMLGLALLPATLGAAPAPPPPPPAIPTTTVLAGADVVVVEGLPRGIATVAVLRAGAVAATATGPVGPGVGDGAGLVAGAAGGCWADPFGRPATPRLRPGDVVAVGVDGVPYGTTAVPDAGVDGPAELRGGLVVAHGHVAPGTDPTAVEHAVVDPGLAATDLGRGDVRAAVGPPTRAPGGGYVSQLTVSGTEVTATYLFDDPGTAARVAASPGARLTLESDAPPGVRRGAVVTGSAAPRPCAPGPPTAVPEAVPALGPSGVVLLAPPGTSIYYTTDGTDPRHVDRPSSTARRYGGLVVVTAPRTIVSWVVFDQVTGLFGPRRTAVVDPVR